MKSIEKVAIVTGGNRGLGFEICRQLATLGITVVLTSRNEKEGLAACKQLDRQELPVVYFPLDVVHAASIIKLGEFMKGKYGRCDILVNNAGIFPDVEDGDSAKWPSVFETKPDTIRRGLETNVCGPLLLCQEFVPFMKKQKYGRIVNMSSGMGQLSEMNGGCPGYRISKTALNALTRVLSDELKEENILVNSMCPGWVKTRMGGKEAPKSVEEGADTAVWLATLPDKGARGGFFRDRKPIPW